MRMEVFIGLRWWFKRSRLAAGKYSDSVIVFQRWCREWSLPIHRRGAVIDRARARHPHFISALDRTRAALRHWQYCDVLVYPTHAFLSFLKTTLGFSLWAFGELVRTSGSGASGSNEP